MAAGLKFVAFVAVAVPIAYLSWWTSKAGIGPMKADSSNYEVVFADPPGWEAAPHGPQSLVLYKHPEKRLAVRGASNRLEADVNPTPELDTDGIAQFFVDRTRENMPDWKAERLDRVVARETAFRLIRREAADRVVVTAYAVKGNTTVLVSLAGFGAAKGAVDPTLPEFRRYLSTLALRPMR